MLHTHCVVSIVVQNCGILANSRLIDPEGASRIRPLLLLLPYICLRKPAQRAVRASRSVEVGREWRVGTRSGFGRPGGPGFLCEVEMCAQKSRKEQIQSKIEVLLTTNASKVRTSEITVRKPHSLNAVYFVSFFTRLSSAVRS